MPNALRARPSRTGKSRVLQTLFCGEEWLVCVDFQNIFRGSNSPFAAEDFDIAFANTKRLVPYFGQRVIFTRWLPTAPREGAWVEYFEEHSHADISKDDPIFDLCPEAKHCIQTMELDRKTIDTHTFNKFDAQMQKKVGQYPHIVLCGVLTECCVLATAIAAIDAGCKVSIILDACAPGRDYMQDHAEDMFETFRPSAQVWTTQDYIDYID